MSITGPVSRKRREVHSAIPVPFLPPLVPLRHPSEKIHPHPPNFPRLAAPSRQTSGTETQARRTALAAGYASRSRSLRCPAAPLPPRPRCHPRRNASSAPPRTGRCRACSRRRPSICLSPTPGIPPPASKPPPLLSRAGLRRRRGPGHPPAPIIVWFGSVVVEACILRMAVKSRWHLCVGHVVGSRVSRDSSH